MIELKYMDLRESDDRMDNIQKVLLGILMILFGGMFASSTLIGDVMIWILVLLILYIIVYNVFNRIRIKYNTENKYIKVCRYLFLGSMFISSMLIQRFIK